MFTLQVMTHKKSDVLHFDYPYYVSFSDVAAIDFYCMRFSIFLFCLLSTRRVCMLPKV